MARWAPPAIVSAALTGDEVAAEQLVAAVWPGCFRLAATVIGDASLAQDAAQEACVIVHRKVRSVRSAGAFDTWLYRIVMREAARVRRRHHDTGQSTFERFSGSDETTAMDVWRALGSLTPELRDVIVLFYFDDLKSDEIAGILRIAHATVRTRLARARERLRGLLGDYRDEPLPAPLEMKQHGF
ncbi:MAG: subfamily polymerase sigma-70 factor [Candidatus Eremiobacteraeota bacterium]|nr:subfamily polymerase sigma-70 factor [Candidatus Eremiobacteraeota bacterium]